MSLYLIFFYFFGSCTVRTVVFEFDKDCFLQGQERERIDQATEGALTNT